jgi:hypothetical protein
MPLPCRRLRALRAAGVYYLLNVSMESVYSVSGCACRSRCACGRVAWLRAATQGPRSRSLCWYATGRCVLAWIAVVVVEWSRPCGARAAGVDTHAPAYLAAHTIELSASWCAVLSAAVPVLQAWSRRPPCTTWCLATRPRQQQVRSIPVMTPAACTAPQCHPLVRNCNDTVGPDAALGKQLQSWTTRLARCAQTASSSECPVRWADTSSHVLAGPDAHAAEAAAAAKAAVQQPSTAAAYPGDHALDARDIAAAGTLSRMACGMLCSSAPVRASNQSIVAATPVLPALLSCSVLGGIVTCTYVRGALETSCASPVSGIVRQQRPS